MAWELVGVILDSGGRELGKLLSGLAVVVLIALLLAVSAPVALIAGVTPGWIAPPPTRPGARGPTPVPVLPAPIGAGPVDIARRYLGVPYVFGGSNPATGLDCSGLVQLVFHELGITLPRTAQLQYAATTRVPRAELQPGDRVFFARTYADPYYWRTHVGIYDCA